MSTATDNNKEIKETAIEYVEKYLGKLSGYQKRKINQIIGVKIVDDLLFLEEDMLLQQQKNIEENDEDFTPVQKHKLIIISKYMKLSLNDKNDDGTSNWDPNMPLSDMYQYVNNCDNDERTISTSNNKKKVVKKPKDKSICVNKPKAEAQLDENDLFSRHLIVTKYHTVDTISNDDNLGKGYLLLFPPEWHKKAEEVLQIWPSSWDVWQFCQLNNVDMFFPAPAKMVHEGGYLKIELDDDFVSDLWSLCISTWNSITDK